MVEITSNFEKGKMSEPDNGIVMCVLSSESKFQSNSTPTPNPNNLVLLAPVAVHKNWNRSILGVVPSIYWYSGWQSHCADMVSISNTISEFWEYRRDNS